MASSSDLGKLASQTALLATAPLRGFIPDLLGELRKLTANTTEMAESVRTLPDVAETLARIEVATVSMEAEVTLMRKRVDQLDDRMAELHADLGPLSRVAGRFGGRKKKGKQDAEEVVVLLEETTDEES
jgi:hypothetical protein